MFRLEVAVVRRETARAFQLVYWCDRRGRHVINWIPRSLVKTEAAAGMRDVQLELYSMVAQLPEWAFLLEDEQDEFRASQARNNHEGSL